MQDLTEEPSGRHHARLALHLVSGLLQAVAIPFLGADLCVCIVYHESPQSFVVRQQMQGRPSPLKTERTMPKSGSVGAAGGGATKRNGLRRSILQIGETIRTKPSSADDVHVGKKAVPDPVSGKKKSKSKTTKEMFESSASLYARAEQLRSQAAGLERSAEEAADLTLMRKLGRALKARIGHGSKDAIRTLLREFDANGDGLIQRIEMRQMVRNHLKIVADNHEIDAFFKEIDNDNSGEVDLDEFITW